MLRLLTCSAAVLAALLLPQQTQACTCGGVPSPMEAFANSDAVFSGKVVSVEATGATCSDFVTVTITNESVWKGPALPTIKLRTAANDGCCGLNFRVGEQYLVYASNSMWLEGLAAQLCSRTRTLASAEEDLDWLGPPKSRVPSEARTWGAIKALFE